MDTHTHTYTHEERETSYKEYLLCFVLFTAKGSRQAVGSRQGSVLKTKIKETQGTNKTKNQQTLDI